MQPGDSLKGHVPASPPPDALLTWTLLFLTRQSFWGTLILTQYFSGVLSFLKGYQSPKSLTCLFFFLLVLSGTDQHHVLSSSCCGVYLSYFPTQSSFCEGKVERQMIALLTVIWCTARTILLRLCACMGRNSGQNHYSGCALPAEFNRNPSLTVFKGLKGWSVCSEPSRMRCLLICQYSNSCH